MSILEQIWRGAIDATLAEQIATVLGVVGVWLAMRESLWNFPVGLVQVAIFGWVCFHGKLYSETLLQGFFFAALVYGWVNWTRGAQNADNKLPVRRLSARELVAWSGATLILWVLWSEGMAKFTDAALPFADGFVFALSVSSQWLQAKKVVENWIGWLIANTAAVGVFWYKQYYWFAALYLVFWFLAWGGWRAWRHSMHVSGKTHAA